MSHNMEVGSLRNIIKGNIAEVLVSKASAGATSNRCRTVNIGNYIVELSYLI